MGHEPIFDEVFHINARAPLSESVFLLSFIMLANQ
jgi:hypothetical protein